jgi:hypothetical protein
LEIVDRHCWLEFNGQRMLIAAGPTKRYVCQQQGDLEEEFNQRRALPLFARDHDRALAVGWDGQAGGDVVAF